MTDKHLKSLIDRLNNGKNTDCIHLRPLTNIIDLAYVWDAKPKMTDNIVGADGPLRFYFIKNLDGVYIAAVLDMKHDLHWYVDRKHRGKGHLTQAMKDTILFHLFQDREEQRITIDEHQIGPANYNASLNVALCLGFLKGGNNTLHLSKENYQSDDFIYGEDKQITNERFTQFKKQINYLSRYLWFIQTELKMTLGESDLTHELKYLSDEIKAKIGELEDVWWEHQGRAGD